MANYADLRSDRAEEIITQLSTPVEFLRTIAFVEPARTPFTMELLDVALGMCGYVEQRFKYALSCKRPVEWSPQIQPMIWTPTHGALPSGHSTEAFCLAQLLWKILQTAGTTPYSQQLWGEMMMRQASRIAINRTVAGVHFPVDSAAGAVLGLNLADYLAKRCTKKPVEKGWSFDGECYHEPDGKGGTTAENLDFNWRDYYKFDGINSGLADETDWVSYDKHKRKCKDTASAPLCWLWDKAVAEWKDIKEDENC